MTNTMNKTLSLILIMLAFMLKETVCVANGIYITRMYTCSAYAQ